MGVSGECVRSRQEVRGRRINSMCVCCNICVRRGDERGVRKGYTLKRAVSKCMDEFVFI